ncbi:hypothetical protein TSOC_004777 [Tetrabaena socialis]|uniref:Uncharacterized protein n=1 Tax=Tetrabaena socialis TaxID=47790 RepID=A0A2J8A861_9CHLO|nr:hypothetical protein TSOC_004777 [Tetrabaena socialis]|eukprot:PNH08680.1 hypothetical protein TSOC_004777 [Tetrabaena socialis]
MLLAAANPAHNTVLVQYYASTKAACSCCSFKATGPRRPSPTTRPSTSTTGMTPAKVPVTNASSAPYTCVVLLYEVEAACGGHTPARPTLAEWRPSSCCVGSSTAEKDCSTLYGSRTSTCGVG